MRFWVIFLLLIKSAALGAAAIPIRTPIASFPITPKSVSRVELTKVDFQPGQEMPAHMHPVPVVCFVTKGTFLVSIGDLPVRRVDVGQATIEPAGTVVHYFRNTSLTLPAQLNCAFLAGPQDKRLSIVVGASGK